MKKLYLLLIATLVSTSVGFTQELFRSSEQIDAQIQQLYLEYEQLVLPEYAAQIKNEELDFMQLREQLKNYRQKTRPPC